MKRLTKEQAIIISAYTGYLCCDFGDMHKAIEEKMGRPVWTHEMASGNPICKEIKRAFKEDFVALCPEKATK